MPTTPRARPSTVLHAHIRLSQLGVFCWRACTWVLEPAEPHEEQGKPARHQGNEQLPKNGPCDGPAPVVIDLPLVIGPCRVRRRSLEHIDRKLGGAVPPRHLPLGLAQHLVKQAAGASGGGTRSDGVERTHGDVEDPLRLRPRRRVGNLCLSPSREQREGVQRPGRRCRARPR